MAVAQQVVQASSSAGKNNSAAINQMLIPDYAFGGSMSAVDELLNYKLDELIRRKDEEQIIHERQKSEQLKELDRQRKEEIKRIQDEANDELEYLAERIKHEVKASMEGGIINEETRKKELQRQSKQNVIKAQEKSKTTESSKNEANEQKFVEKLSQLKSDEEGRNQKEVDVIKRKYDQKIKLEKEKQKQANS